ncbi:MAG: phage tail sheath C-terminal domain-containing protein [Candidatus Nitrosotenuis sp.]
MATLVSPGVSVSVTDESFYIPVSAPTVPLFFVATRKNKRQPNGVDIATATNESSVVRTVTSLGQSTQLYGIPYFWQDAGKNQFHGDARNEYGLFALNQFLGIGNRAFVVRANIDLTDATINFIGVTNTNGTQPPLATVPNLIGAGNGTMTTPVVASALVQPDTYSVVCISPATYDINNVKTKAARFNVLNSHGFIGIATEGTVFSTPLTPEVSFTITEGTSHFAAGDYFTFSTYYVPLTSPTGAGKGTMTNLMPAELAVEETWTVTFSTPTTFDVSGSVFGPSTSGTVGVPYDNNYINFTIVDGTTPFVIGDTFTVVFKSLSRFNPLGSTDAQKRVTITTALQAEINSNTEIRSEMYEYNLILCPGYPEVVDELLALSNDVNEEAFVIADAPVDKTPEQVATWANTSERFSSHNVAYYYPWGLASNLDGTNVVVAPSGIALRTYAFSDNESYVWFAPAGPNRGLVTGVSKVGYVTGELGTPTTFIEANLNQGQRDNLYEFFKNINPIVYFTGRGLMVFGQKTAAPVASALDRINVVRLVMYIKRGIRKGMFTFLFEPNDQITRDNVKNAIDGYLGDIMIKRGLYDFATICDASNNTPTRIDRNELWADVAIKPVKAVEFIYVPIRILSTGAAMGTA